MERHVGVILEFCSLLPCRGVEKSVGVSSGVARDILSGLMQPNAQRYLDDLNLPHPLDSKT